MKSTSWFKRMTTSVLAGSLLAAGIAVPTGYAAPGTENQAPSSGKWMTGEYHTHTHQSDDAQTSLEDVLDHALEVNNMDWLGISDHLRMQGRDDTGAAVPGGPIPLSKGIGLYQLPKIEQLQAGGKYKDKVIFTGFEWDMPTYDHVGVGILPEELKAANIVEAISHFEYLFTNRSESLYDPQDVSRWSAADSRAYSTKADARKAVQWLKDNYPNSYMIINHPSRKKGDPKEFKIEDIRDFNTIAPDIAFGFEGMLGNQMAPDRGEVAQAYGGTDIMVAQLGGVWDALLGEGRRFWNFANSDYHFRIDSTRRYSSGYMPGDYSKNYTWVDGSDMHAVVDGMRSGKSFSVFGDLINALDFRIAGAGQEAEMGGDLKVTQGDDMELTIRFKSPERNHNDDPVAVDHVDLIAGDVTGLATPGTAGYTKSTNDTTKVLKRFTSNEWTTDEDGYNVITYKLGPAQKNQYFRLRGTNLGVDVAGETSNGEPLIDVKNTTVDNETRFTEINKRNYSDLWFYSNPIFVDVAPYSDEQAVQDTAAQLSLGDTSAIVDDLKLPAAGEHGVSVQWASSNSELIGHDGRLLVRYPAEDTDVTLTATMTRGGVSVTKTFVVTVKGFGDTSPAELKATMTTVDGKVYESGSWTNQSVMTSVYAVYSDPITEVALELSMDGSDYDPYTADEKIEVSDEGGHTLTFRATDNLNLQKTQAVQVNIDRTAPVITLRGTPTVNLTVGSSYTEAGADTADNVGLASDVQVSGMVDTNTAGTYTLRYNVSDLAGNPAAEVIRTVHVLAGGENPGNGNDDSDDDDDEDSGDNGGSDDEHSDDSDKGHSGGDTEQPASKLIEVPAGQAIKGELAGVIRIDVPAGVWNTDSQIKAVVLEEGAVPAAAGMTRISPVVGLTNDAGNTLGTAVKLTFHYDTGAVSSNNEPAVYYYHEQQGRWVFIGGINNGDGTVTASVNHFAKFAVFSYEPKVFSDLTGHWALPFAERLVGMNAIQGFEDQSFHPDEPTTRAQFVKILTHALGISASDTATSFADDAQIPDWARQQAAAALEAGLIQGSRENGRIVFNADKLISRAELAVMLANALDATSETSGTSGSGSGVSGQFTDASGIPSWARTSITTAVNAGILKGYPDGTFQPDRAVTRAEAITAIYRLLDALHI
ncbi:S-layer homology domain-containing protein [Paenibacillus sp. P96]|uniref:S-layer homology domain-containing protein n=1 Tax=Paenibacillus zeirhizosphaerae TaxID=2987519 RepID=A0ABT9FXJ0_9BACL|nr:S-layer homology domain-containing protein [Paenibacillus sp. P96]MDP4099445.1 S-layer homology domain-containing protein [Paenibacillus sp. P96]